MNKVALVVTLVVGCAVDAWSQQPVTLTSSTDFQRGNNEGLVSPNQGQVTRAPISNGTLSGWTNLADLPEARYANTTVVHGGFIYTLGGLGEFFDLVTVVRYAPLNSDGSVGSWSATTELPAGRAMHSSVAYNGFLYVFAGNAEGFSPATDVFVAPFNADGSLGDWTPTTSLPSERFGQATVAWNGYVYCVGGGVAGATAVTDVLVAPVRADGTLGDWEPATDLPSARLWHSCICYNGFLYAIGGYDDNGAMTSVLVAPINPDGTLGDWSDAEALPSGRYAHSGFVHDGFVYAIAGTEGNGPISDSVVAAVNPDGSLGSWSPASGFFAASVGHSSVAFNGYAYALGGLDENSMPMASVRVAALEADSSNGNQEAPRLRGVYSHLVDLQADVANRYVVLYGDVPAGANLRLQVRVAPAATGVFASETVVDSAPLGSPILIPGTGRYAWLRVTFDDTGVSDPLQHSLLTDIIVTPTAPPSAGAVSDGSGADIDSQTSTSTIEANWTGFTPDPSDSIASYEWSIGTAPGLTNVQGWVNVGTATSATNSTLALGTGMKFVSVRAISAAGLTSPVATSDGVQVLPGESAPPSDGHDHRRCGSAASAGSGTGLAWMAALVFAMAVFGRLK